MAEPIGIASGLLALTIFAFNSSVALYQVVDSFQSNKRVVRELKEELKSLDDVLQSLREATANHQADLATLKLPLFRCGQACKDFEAVIAKCTAHSGGSKTSFRDWAKLTYMGDDIVGFKNMLAGYKSTISIALGDANFRTAKVTAGVLKEYKELIAQTTSDLEDHLQEIEKRLDSLPSGDTVSLGDAAERERVQEEKESTKQCLAICAQFSQQVNQLRPNVFEDVSTADHLVQVDVSSSTEFNSAKQVTDGMLREFQEKLSTTTSKLEDHLKGIDKTLQSLPLGHPPKDTPEQKQLQEDLESIKQCLVICTQASEQANHVRTNNFEDVIAGDEAYQLIVATLGDLISAKRVNAGVGTTQWLGQMADATLQQLSGDRGLGSRHIRSSDRGVAGYGEVEARFGGRYGAGYKLAD